VLTPLDRSLKIEKSEPEVVQSRTQGFAKGQIKMTTLIVAQNSNPINPQMVDGIELYATDSESGMSQRGLARFCGVHQTTIQALLVNIGDGQNVPKMLQSLIGQELYVTGKFENGAKVVRSGVCAAICQYYAFESKSANETARFSLQKFSSKGIDSWIRDVTGHSKTPVLSPLESAQQMIIDLQAQLIIKSEENATMAKFIEGAEGLKEIYEGTDYDPEVLSLPVGIDQDGTQWYTARQYLEIMQEEFLDLKIRNQKRLYYKFTGLIAHFYRVYNLGEQHKIDIGTGAPVNAYSTRDFPLLAVAWKQAKQEMEDERLAAIAAKYKR
jgi:hypothetical protein